MSALWIRALGPLQVIADGVRVPVSSRTLHAGQNRLEFAIRLLAAANAYRWDHVRPLDAEEEKRVATITARVRAEAGPIRFGLAWEGGRNLTLRQAVNEVMQGARHTGIPPGAAHPADRYPSTPGSLVDPAPWSRLIVLTATHSPDRGGHVHPGQSFVSSAWCSSECAAFSRASIWCCSSFASASLRR